MNTPPHSVTPAVGVQSNPPLLLRMQAVGKCFAGIRVLEDVDFEVRAGEVHVLAGENGAGKSTLMRILSGVYQDYEGELFLDGVRRQFHSAAEAARAGIAMIHQEMSLVPAMSVADNLFLGREQERCEWWVSPARRRQEAATWLASVGLDIDPAAAVCELPVATRQLIEIAKALACRSRVLVMDEPTSALNQTEVERLFAIIGRLKQEGCGVVYITHKMEEIYRLADRITVLRDGRRVGTASCAELPANLLVRWMVGRDLGEQFPSRPACTDRVRLALEDFSVPDPEGVRPWVAQGIGLEVRAGEILGIAGLQGAGNHELLRALFGGYGSVCTGRAWVDGRVYEPQTPRKALAAGVAFLSSDRKGEGLVLPMSVSQNITLAALDRLSPGGWIRLQEDAEFGAELCATLQVRMAAPEQPVAELSGGNQQKVALGKWIGVRPGVLLLDEPTRGIDVAAKQEIYALLNRWTEAGMAIVLISSELPELLGLSDRVLVMHRGRQAALYCAAEATPERVLHAALGGAVDK